MKIMFYGILEILNHTETFKKRIIGKLNLNFKSIRKAFSSDDKLIMRTDIFIPTSTLSICDGNTLTPRILSISSLLPLIFPSSQMFFHICKVHI